MPTGSQSLTVDDYISAFPADVQEILHEVRRRARYAVPDAGEMIKYGMPAITFGGRYAIYYSGWKSHLGLYPVPELEDALEAEVAPYRAKKSTLQFPYAKGIPYDLIERIIVVAARARGAD